MQPILIPVVRTTIERLEAIAAEDGARDDAAAQARARELNDLARQLQEALTRLQQTPRYTGATPALEGTERLFRARIAGDRYEH